MSIISLCLTAGFGGLVALGFPFAMAIALAVAAALVLADIEPAFLAMNLISGSQQFSLLAIPLFMLAGELMSAGGLSKRLVDFASTLVRHRTGGLAMVCVLAATVFSAISGSAPATTAAIGAIMIPAMEKAGYDKAFAASIAVSAGVLGPLIPPSIAFVIWGIVAEQSIGRLFLSGIVPGLVLAAGLLVVCWVHAKRNAVPKLPRASWGEGWQSLKSGIWALGSPLVVLGGIYGGVFTPTESAAVGCAATFLVGVLRRTLNARRIRESLQAAAETTAMIFVILLGAEVFNAFLALSQAPDLLAMWVSEQGFPPYGVLIAFLVAYIILGAVMDELAMILLTLPVFFPVITALDFGLGSTEETAIWFGILVLIVVGIGLTAPPIGLNVFVISGLARDVPIGRIYRGVLPFLMTDFVRLALCIAFPGLSLWLVRMLI